MQHLINSIHKQEMTYGCDGNSLKRSSSLNIMERKLRYYSPIYDEEKHSQILELLELIKSLHGIEYEEIPVKKTDWYQKEPVMSEWLVYEEHMKPMAKTIAKNCGESPARIFKTRSGNISIAGTVAVIDEFDRVVYVSKYNPGPLDFLKQVLREGKRLLWNFEAAKDEPKDVHKILLRKMFEFNLPEPDIPRNSKIWIPEVATGFRRMGIKEEDMEYNPAWEKDGIKIVDKDLYRGYLQKKLSPKLRGNMGIGLKDTGVHGE